jgi:hypothetical protein
MAFTLRTCVNPGDDVPGAIKLDECVEVSVVGADRVPLHIDAHHCRRWRYREHVDPRLDVWRSAVFLDNLVGTAPWGTKIEPNFGWLIDMFRSLERYSAMLPVRDGVSFGLKNQKAGLCFIYGENIDTWPQVCPSGNPPPCTPGEMVDLNLQETNQINSSGGSERVDATVSWRPRDATKFPPL